MTLKFLEKMSLDTKETKETKNFVLPSVGAQNMFG